MPPKKLSTKALQISAPSISSRESSGLGTSPTLSAQAQVSSGGIQESGFPENGNTESDLVDCKKVAMRLSVAATLQLKQWRSLDGIPAEIVVDVLIRNWSNLTPQQQSDFLQQARTVRAARLIAGQTKALDTLKDRLHHS